ncbi:TetR/AcrR family transcriptional regulator [Nonomuraea pusilla]|uniref:TetR/AcrR family transcriptional regulator n=1 Tax=Nonomuraea pusilla TaxID=46177 RepID=UPI0007C7FC3C|nr:TetR/AcrR family transcriptional regulator [Nonomuraea pusilla]
MDSLSARAEATRHKLLEAAAAELIETGDVEVAAVARRAGVSVGLPYRYFETRSGLMSALLGDFYDRLVADTVLTGFEGETWLDRWRAQVVTWVERVYRDPLAPVVLGRMVGDAQVAAMEARCFSQVVELGVKHVAAGQAEGALAPGRDPELLASGVVGGMRAIFTVVLERDPRPALDEVVREVWAFTVAALGAAPQAEREPRP